MKSGNKHQEKSQQVQVISFYLDNIEFGIEIENVQEVIKLVEITQIPRIPKFVEGVINLRGKVTPVLNLRKKFGLKNKNFDLTTAVIIVNIDDKVLGLLVDRVSEVLELPIDTIEEGPVVATEINKHYFKGIGKLEDRLLVILGVEKILTEKEKKQLWSN